MEEVLSTLHRCLKYLHNKMIHCIIGKLNHFIHYNSTFSPTSLQIPCGCIFPNIIIMDNHPNMRSSHSYEPSFSYFSSIPYASSSQPSSSSPSSMDPFMYWEDKSPYDSAWPSNHQIQSIPISRNDQPSYHLVPPPKKRHVSSSFLVSNSL